MNFDAPKMDPTQVGYASFKEKLRSNIFSFLKKNVATRHCVITLIRFVALAISAGKPKAIKSGIMISEPTPAIVFNEEVIIVKRKITMSS